MAIVVRRTCWLKTLTILSSDIEMKIHSQNSKDFNEFLLSFYTKMLQQIIVEKQHFRNKLSKI